MEVELKHKVKKGLLWVFLSQVANQGLFVWFAIYLARVLSPELFGVVGLVTVFSNYASYFVDLGFGTALVQKKDLDQGHLSTIFWFNMLAASILGALFYLSAPWLAALYDEPRLVPVTRIIAASFILSSFGLVQSNLLHRKLEFKKRVSIGWIGSAIGYLIGIGMALAGYGLWALVAQLMLTLAANSAILWFTSTWRPSFEFSVVKLKELLPFGLNVLGDTSVNYWSRNADNFLVGKFVGTEALGIYSRAYSLMLLPIRNVSSIITRVMFPAFSKIQDNLEDIRAIYLRTIRYVAFVTFPAATGLTIVAPEFVFVCFGEQWVAMTPVLRWLAMLGSVQSILNLNGMIYNSLGKPHIAFRVSLVVNALLLVSFGIGIAAGGLMGITIAYFIASTVMAIPIYKVAITQISLSLRQAGAVLLPTLLSTAFMALGLALLRTLVPIESHLALLLTSIACGAALYALFQYFFDKEFRSLVRRIIPGQP